MEQLLAVVEKHDIYIKYVDLQRRSPTLLGAFVEHQKEGPLILLDKSLPARPRLERCVLAEEIGHAMYPPRPGHIRFHRHRFCVGDNQSVIVEQDENKALKWATDFLIPDAEFWRAGRQGIDTVYALAEHFYVAEWFVRKKVGFIRRRARDRGVRLAWSDIIRRDSKSFRLGRVRAGRAEH